MEYKKFLYTLESVSSDMYVFLLVFLLQKRPFSTNTLNEYEKQKSTFLKLNSSSSPNRSPNKLLASPNLRSKFSPSTTLSKSPKHSSTCLSMKGKKSHNKLLQIAGMSLEESKRTEVKSKTVQIKKDLKITLNAESTVKVLRKVRNNLKKMDTINNKDEKEDSNDYDDLIIMPAAKISNASLDVNMMEAVDDNDNEEVQHEGHLYKVTDQKQIKRLWFKLVHRDLYCKFI
jgi:hypothetical protein